MALSRYALPCLFLLAACDPGASTGTPHPGDGGAIDTADAGAPEGDPQPATAAPPERTWNSASDLDLAGLPAGENQLRAACGQTAERGHALQILCHFVEAGELGWFQGTPSTETGEPVRISYVAFRPPQPPRAALVIVNGFGESYLYYAELIHDLTVRNRDLGYAVYLYDHRGQGFSDRLLPRRDERDYQRGHVDDFASYVADLETFLDRVVAVDRVTPVFVWAHSMGAAVTTAYLQGSPDESLVAAAVLSSPMYELPGTTALHRAAAATAVTVGLGQRYAAGQGPWHATALDASRNTRCPQRHAFTEYLAATVPELRQGGPTLRWSREALSLLERLEHPEPAGQVTLPLLLLSAERDQLVGRDGQRRVCAQMPGCVFETVPGARHHPIQELDEIRRPYLARVIAFLERQLSAAAAAAR
jgi:lysophospholipase